MFYQRSPFLLHIATKLFGNAQATVTARQLLRSCFSCIEYMVFMHISCTCKNRLYETDMNLHIKALYNFLQLYFLPFCFEQQSVPTEFFIIQLFRVLPLVILSLLKPYMHPLALFKTCFYIHVRNCFYVSTIMNFEVYCSNYTTLLSSQSAHLTSSLELFYECCHDNTRGQNSFFKLDNDISIYLQSHNIDYATLNHFIFVL